MGHRLLSWQEASHKSERKYVCMIFLLYTLTLASCSKEKRRGCAFGIEPSTSNIPPDLVVVKNAVTFSAFRVFPGSLMRTLWSMALTPHRECGRAVTWKLVSSPGTAEGGTKCTDTWCTQNPNETIQMLICEVNSGGEQRWTLNKYLASKIMWYKWIWLYSV